jgi:hypothetical protein
VSLASLNPKLKVFSFSLISLSLFGQESIVKLRVCFTFAFAAYPFVTLCNASPSVITVKLLVYRIVEPLEVGIGGF